MNNLLKYLSFYDKLLILIIMLISMGLIVFPFLKTTVSSGKDGNPYIVIKGEQNYKKVISMKNTYSTKPLIYKVEGPIGTSIIEADKGRVRIKEAPEADPLKICEKTGWISEPGPSIICVPNKVVVKIKSSVSDIDGITW